MTLQQTDNYTFLSIVYHLHHHKTFPAKPVHHNKMYNVQCTLVLHQYFVVVLQKLTEFNLDSMDH